MQADKDGLTSSVRNYVRRMIADAGPGMKALLLDQATVRATGCAV